jgi:Leucine-rich repeat (LRR) protein
MKNIIRLLFIILFGVLFFQCSREQVPDAINFHDKGFFAALRKLGIDKNNDGIISLEEAAEVNSLFIDQYTISDLKGIEEFVNLTFLNCSYNRITSLDLSNNTSLQVLDCSGNHFLSSLNVSNCVKLKKLYCTDNKLTNLDVTNNTNLRDLYCRSNLLTTLDLSNCPELIFLNCGENLLVSLDLSKNPKLYSMLCEDNLLTSLDVLKNSELNNLNCRKNKLTSLVVSDKPKLNLLYCEENSLTRLDVWDNPLLVELNCRYNLLTSLDVSTNYSIQFFDIGFMPSLYKVCVWRMPSPTSGPSLNYVTTGSPNAYFTTDCNK